MSDFLRREFFKNYSISPAHTIPIGVDKTSFPPIRPSSRDIDVLGVGSLIPLKQYHVFVDVIRQIAAGKSNVKAIICGNGPEKAELEKQIETGDLGENILLAGEIPHNDVLGLMQRTRVFLHTSNYEGFGTVCLEALCAGAHVVSFTKPMDQAIPHWHHVTTIEEMAEKVLELLINTDISFDPVIPYTTEYVAKMMMKLYLT